MSGENTPTKDSEVYWQSFSYLLSGRIEGCQTGVQGGGQEKPKKWLRNTWTALYFISQYQYYS